MVPYESKIEGSSLLITLAATGGAQQAATGGAARFAEGRSDVQHALKDVNFRRGRGGEGRIVVELSDTSTGVDIRQQGQTVIVDFLKTSISEVLRKRYDVVDFATPVQTFSVFPQGDNVRMVIEPRVCGAQRLPDRHSVRARGETDPVRSQQTGAGHAQRLFRPRSCRSTSRMSR